MVAHGSARPWPTWSWNWARPGRARSAGSYPGRSATRPLEIGYWLPDRAAFVNAEGGALALPDTGSGRSVTVVEREGQPVAVLVHDPAVLADPGLLEAVTAAAQLAAANARLRAEVQTRVEELATLRRSRAVGRWPRMLRWHAGGRVRRRDAYAHARGARLGR